jgi:dUTP pyrophosphatase
MKSKEILFKKIKKDAKIPERMYQNDAGFDVYANSFKFPTRMIVKGKKKKVFQDAGDEVVLNPSGRVLVMLGFAVALPDDYYLKVVPRSGLALWDGITVLNSPGTIDAGYRKELSTIIINTSKENVKIEKGERICQMIPTQMANFHFREADELPKSERGKNGFGSTGKK